MGLFKGWLEKLFAGNGGNSADAPISHTAKPQDEEKHFKVVRVQPTPNPDAFQFIMSGPVIAAGTTKTFESAEDAKDDLLAEALFAIFGVENVFLKENFVTVTKSKVVGWHTLMEPIGETIEEHLRFIATAKTQNAPKPEIDPVLAEFNKEDFVNCTDEQKTKVIEALLDVAVRPALSNDGGGLDIIGIEGNVVKIHYQGACGSCPSSTTGTLNYIENFLKEAIHPDLVVQAN